MVLFKMIGSSLVKVSEEMAVIIRAANLDSNYTRFNADFDRITVLDLHDSWVQYIMAVLPTTDPECRKADG